MAKRRKTYDEQKSLHQDDDYIPLPIQTFLWSRTSPFVRPFLGKSRDLAQMEQRDACRTFESVIITNNIFGQSLGLTDAIASIDRWRLIKVSFPFVLQCTAALLNNKLIKDHNLKGLGANEAKMMYTLQWILMNASEECADSENEAKANATNAAIAAATAASLLKPNAISSGPQNFPLGSTTSSMTNPTENQLQAGTHSPSQKITSDQHQESASGINLASAARAGSASSCVNQSIIIPAASAVASAVAIAAPGTMSTLQMQTTLPSSSSVSPIGSSTPTKPPTPTQQGNASVNQDCTTNAACPSNFLLPVSSIQMFVYYFAPIMDGLKHSDFLTSNQRLEIGAALWEPLFNHRLPNIQCLIAGVKPGNNAESDNIPFVSSELRNSDSYKTKYSTFFPVGEGSQHDQTSLPIRIAGDERRRSSSMLQDQSIYGDVFLGGPTGQASTSSTKHPTADSRVKDLSDQKHAPVNPDFSIIQSDTEQRYPTITTATYLDIGVLRCLFINDWQETGVYWSLTFLSNRMNDLHYGNDGGGITTNALLRSRSLSELDEKIINLMTSKSATVSGLEYDKYGNRAPNANGFNVERKNNSLHRLVGASHDSERKFLRVDDLDNSDSGNDSSTIPKSPVRRLSFSSGMQTIANQIKKTSKRVKKSSDNQQAADNLVSKGRYTMYMGSSMDASSPTSPKAKMRRSSSAEDLNSSQISALSNLHKETSKQGSKFRENYLTDFNPVITVTSNSSHRSQRSRQSMKRNQEIDGAETDRHFALQRLYRRSLRRLDRLTRSQSVPDDIYYSNFETKKGQVYSAESLGAAYYVDDRGRIDPLVVLKVLHFTSQKDSACSHRVCDRIITLLKKLIDIGLLNEKFDFTRHLDRKDLTNLLPTRQKFNLFYDKSGNNFEYDSGNEQHAQEMIERSAMIHKIMIDIVIRIYHHVGCPNHCGLDSTVDHHQNNQSANFLIMGKSSTNLSLESSRSLRARLRETLCYLCQVDKPNFIAYIEALVTSRALQQVVDIFHSILGFCRIDGPISASHSGHGSSVQFVTSPSVTGNNLSDGAQVKVGGSLNSPKCDGSRIETSSRQKAAENLDSIIISHSFKQLVSRMANINKELKLQENTSLYCDIRQFINFIRENHNGVFRRIVLSALIDCAKIVNKNQKPTNGEQQIVRKVGDLTRPSSDDESNGQGRVSGLKRGKLQGEFCETNIDRERTRLTTLNGLSSSSSAIQQSPIAQGYEGQSSMQHRTSSGSYGFYQPGNSKHSKNAALLQSLNQQEHHHSQGTGILSLSKAKKKLEQVFGGKPTNKVRLNSSQLGEDLAQSGSIGPSDGYRGVGSAYDEASRRASIVGHQSMSSMQESNVRNIATGGVLPIPLSIQIMNMELLRQNQQMYTTVRTGMSNFSFLMESCSPGDFLDPALLAALLDLKSPVAVRAAIYIECANFVHRCNRGQWPSWMKMNVSGHRTSNSGMVQNSSASKSRKSSSMQRTARNTTQMYRAAGKAFYSWAEAIGARLEELIASEQAESHGEEITEDDNDDSYMISDQGTVTNSQIVENSSSNEIDFFQPTIGNSSSPFSLKMVACQLLYEVTTFLRETYRYLPPTIVHHHAATSKLGDKIASIYDVSRAVTANRRWSMALSSLGFGQLPATLNAISAGTTSTVSANANNVGGGSHLRNPTSSVISEHPERRISFILHETNDENETQDDQNDAAGASDSNSGQVVTSPIAPSINSNEQQQDAMRKMTAGRHLSQSSASSAVVVAAATCLLRSSGVIENQSHRRKSIKLKKSSQDKDKTDRRTKFAHDLDEENENSSTSDTGIRRTDSLRSRRRVSGISEKSDTSDRALNGLQHVSQDNQGPVEYSGDESAGNGSCEDACANDGLAEKLEADESRIMSNMPWFKAITMINSSIDCECTHYQSCKPNCYKMHQAMCKKLVASVQTIYEDSDDEQNYISSVFESRLATLISSENDQRSSCQDIRGTTSSFHRSGSDCSAHDGPDSKRKDKKSKKQQIESPHDDVSHLSPKGKRHNEKPGNRLQSIISFNVDPSNQQNGISNQINDAIKALTAVKAKKRSSAQRTQEKSQIIKYMRSNVRGLLQTPISSFLKGAVILSRDTFVDMIKFSWSLLLEDDQQLARTAAVGFIIASIKSPSEASKLLIDELESDDASKKIAAINKFSVIWDARYQCWTRLEDGAFVHFKMAPPSIEFTLPSPKIAQESKPVVDPPWMPRKTSNVEEVTIGQDQTVQKSFVTATKTRRKQQIEIVTRALREKYDKLREDREQYNITSVPVTLYAAYEPTLGNQPGGDEMDGGGNNADDDTQQENRALLQMKTAQALFPTCLCQAAIVMINLLDDSRVTFEGSAVYEVASKVIWSCLVEDPALFLRHFFERLTRQNQSTIFQVLRRLIGFMPRLPPQAAYTLYNYLIGFIIYYIRCPIESSQKLISDTLSVLCLVVPSVYGLFLKDLKQILRKEQCDHNLLITANVPSAKKIIVHGSDSSGIPSQFPIDESTQFYHILVDSLEFFGIDKYKQNEYFLIDVRTNHMHNLNSYVRDHYSFKRSQHPQLQLVNVDPSKAFDILQRQELTNQFLEFGKVSMSLSIVKSPHMAIQRALFLHEELMKLPTFPRRALETNFSLFHGQLGHQIFSMDRIHKISWVRVIARMFELTSGFFLQLGDIYLFLNAVSGIFILHCEEASVSRLCLATFINATHQFKNIFATDGFMPIMSTIVQVYSNHQNNQLLCRSIEFVCKQFYIMHRKPFLLQLFGSVAPRLDTTELSRHDKSSQPLALNPSNVKNNLVNQTSDDPNRISPSAFFRLLQSLEKAFKDPLDILELVDAEKPLRAVDFCYQQDKEAIEILDIISLCVTVTAYASESPRSTQMLIILETVVPLYMKHLQASTSKKAGQSMGKQAHKDELQKIQSISICIKTLIVSSEGLARSFNGPLPSIDFRGSSIRRTQPSGAKSSSSQRGGNMSTNLPIDPYDEPSNNGPERSKREQSTGHTSGKTMISGQHRANKRFSSDESELTRSEFTVPRDTLLNLVAEFLSLSTGRLVESAKKYVELNQKHSSYELLDVKSHLRLAEIANSLLKFASTDPSVMASRGLIRYMNEILPNTEWRQEAIRPALIMILKRLDKTFNRIAKKTWVKRTTDWEGAKQLLKGAYLTFIKHPYIVHLPHLKSLISCCQNIILSDGLGPTSQISPSNLFHGFSSQQHQSGLAASQSASVIPSQSNELQNNSNLLNLAASKFAPGSSLSPSGSGALHAVSAPNSAHTQAGPSFAAVTVAAALAERMAAQASVSTNSLTSQGFNSVTIRLIAMQLLQTGDSQTLESFIGNSMNTPEKLESLMLNLIYPMCIRVCSGAREAPKLRVCDIMFILNVVLSMLAPQSPSSKSCASTASSPKSTTDTSQFILSKITTTIGSTQTGATALGIVGSSSYSATGTHQLAHHQDSLKIGFLGLKILCVCFESQLAGEWIRISRVIRDLALYSGQTNASLWDFFDFVATYRFPIFILLLPVIKCHLAKKVKSENSKENAAHYIQCQRSIDAKLGDKALNVCRSKSFLYVSLTAELRMLKDQLIAKRRLLMEGERQVSSHSNQQTSSGASGYGNPGASVTTVAAHQGDHLNAYHRLSAAIASFATQNTQGKMTPSGSSLGQMSGTSAALKGTCFAAQLATSTPISGQISESNPVSACVSRNEPSQSSIKLSTAKSREEARKMMNTILRRTSYPHNHTLLSPEQQSSSTNERKNSQPPSPSSTTTANRQSNVDLENGKSSQIIMDPAMLMAAFPRKSTVEGSGILRQLIQTIDRQNSKPQKQQAYQTTELVEGVKVGGEDQTRSPDDVCRVKEIGSVAPSSSKENQSIAPSRATISGSAAHCHHDEAGKR